MTAAMLLLCVCLSPGSATPQDEPPNASAKPAAAAGSGCASLGTATPRLLDAKDITIWYLKSLRAVEKDSRHAIFALLDAGITADQQLDAQRSGIRRAEEVAVDEIAKTKAKLLKDLAKSPNGVAAPPIFKVRSEKEHLDEIRKSLVGGK